MRRSNCGGRKRSPNSDSKRSEEHTSELQSRFDLVCRLLLEKKQKVTVCRQDARPLPPDIPRPVDSGVNPSQCPPDDARHAWPPSKSSRWSKCPPSHPPNTSP